MNGKSWSVDSKRNPVLEPNLREGLYVRAQVWGKCGGFASLTLHCLDSDRWPDLSLDS